MSLSPTILASNSTGCKPTTAAATTHYVANGLLLDATKEALPLLLIQVLIVLVVTRIMAKLLHYFKQPPVIGEIIGGIILGPSVLGYAKGWTSHLFPTTSLGGFSLIANIGLIFFMLFLGMELDWKLVKREARTSVPIAAAAIIIPFGIGAACAHWWYIINDRPTVNKVAFTLFAGASMSFTALPVLASLLQAKKLIGERIGVQSISCAAVDDVMAWCVLAIASSFAKSGNALSGFYTFLLAILYVFIMLTIVRPLIARLHQHYLAKDDELNRNFTVAVFMMVILSALASEVIGIHTFFGAFLAGLIIPREGKFIHEIAPKIELIIVDVFLPLYFANSGLKTDIGSLNTGALWGTALAVFLIATVAKFGSATLACKLVTGRDWRFCTTLGVLMNTRGLVELIALNIGRDMGLLAPRMFTILVLMALFTTFSTSPLLHVLWLNHVRPEQDIVPNTHGAKQSTEHHDESLSDGDQFLQARGINMLRIQGAVTPDHQLLPATELAIVKPASVVPSDAKPASDAADGAANPSNSVTVHINGSS